MVTEIFTETVLTGLSTDAKPTNYPNGTKYREIDTGLVYRFDKEHMEWRLQ